MKLGLLVFGQFRAWEDVLEDNLNTLQQQFQGFDVDVFFLTDKLPKGMYSNEAESTIQEKLQSKGFTLKSLWFWEDLQQFHQTDKAIQGENQRFLQDTQPSWKNDWMFNLWYRRYVLWNLVEHSVNLQDYQTFFFCRLFDTTIQIHYPIQSYLLDSTTLYMCIDLLFFGSPEHMKQLFQFGSSASNWKHFEWNPEFKQAYLDIDYNIAKREHTLCSETQAFYYIYTSIPKWKTLRLDCNISNTPTNDRPMDVRIVRHMTIPRKVLSLTTPTTHENFQTFLLTQEKQVEFLKFYFPQYDKLPPSLFPYLWIYINGGFYFTSSITPLLSLRSIYEMTDQAELLVSMDTSGNLSSEFIASTSGNPALFSIIEDLLKASSPRLCNTLKYFEKNDNTFTFLTHPEGICYGNQLILQKSLNNQHVFQ